MISLQLIKIYEKKTRNTAPLPSMIPPPGYTAQMPGILVPQPRPPHKVCRHLFHLVCRWEMNPQIWNLLPPNPRRVTDAVLLSSLWEAQDGVMHPFRKVGCLAPARLSPPDCGRPWILRGFISYLLQSFSQTSCTPAASCSPRLVRMLSMVQWMNVMLCTTSTWSRSLETI